MKQLLGALAALAAMIWVWAEYFREIPHLEQAGVVKNFQVEEQADFSGEFRVLGKRYYGPPRTALYATSPRSGKFNDLAYASSIDLLLGQGQLKNPYLAKKIDFDQKSRCYQFTAEPGAGLTDDAIRADSLSISAVAGSAQAADQLRRLKAGQTVRIQGKYAAVTLRKSQQPFIVGMSIPRPRPHCAIVKVTSIQALN